LTECNLERKRPCTRQESDALSRVLLYVQTRSTRDVGDDRRERLPEVFPTAEQHPVEMSKYGQNCVHASIDDHFEILRLMVDGLSDRCGHCLFPLT